MDTRLIRFQIPVHRLTPSYNRPLQDYLQFKGDMLEAVLVRLQHVNYSDALVRVFCTPTEFATWLVARNHAGLENMFKELNPHTEEATDYPPNFLRFLTQPLEEPTTKQLCRQIDNCNLPVRIKRVLRTKLRADHAPDETYSMSWGAVTVDHTLVSSGAVDILTYLWKD